VELIVEMFEEEGIRIGNRYTIQVIGSGVYFALQLVNIQPPSPGSSRSGSS
jgi:hypothetical protein